MPKIILVPIEPLEERYSRDWHRWFEPYADILIDVDPLTTTITHGSFLDVCGTNYYKSRQLAEICRLIHNGKIGDGDTFLFLDLWFPGLEMLAYMRDALDIDFKITGCLHAGTYDPYDFLSKKGMARWGRDLENSWFEIVDQIFVATNFHKQLICDKRDVYPFKIEVTGFPIKPISLGNIRKENIVVFPHRLDSEKNPDQFNQLVDDLRSRYSNWSFVKSKVCTSNKQEYYELLQKSKIAVSFADQETWGIAMQEASLCNCIPIVPDRLSYQEMYPLPLRFTSYDDAVKMVSWYIDHYEDGLRLNEICRKEFITSGRNAIPNMIEAIYNDK